jgi:hypothetical protein
VPVSTMLALIAVRSMKAPMPLVGPDPDFGLPSVPASQRKVPSLKPAVSLYVLDSEIPPYAARLSVMKDLNTSALLAMDLALKKTNTRANNVAGAQAAWRRRLRVRLGARDRVRAGVLAHGRLRRCLLSVVTMGARGRLHDGAFTRGRLRLLALLQGRPAAVLALLLMVAVHGPGSEPEP